MVAEGATIIVAEGATITSGSPVGVLGWGVKGTYGMQMQAAVTTNKVAARIKIENLLFDIMITCIHSRHLVLAEYSPIRGIRVKKSGN